MAAVSSISRFFSLWADTLRQLGRGRIWLILLAYFLLNWLVLYAHYRFSSPVFYGLVTTWTSLFGQQAAGGFTHYPGHYIMMPYFFGWAKLAYSVLLEGAVLGGIALLFYRVWEPEEIEGSSFKRVLKSWIHLLLGWVLLNGLMLAASMLLPELLGGFLSGSPRRQLAFNVGVIPLIYIFLLSLFLFVIPSVVIFGENVIAAIGRSLRLFAKNPFTCFFLAFCILLLPVAVSKLVDDPQLIVNKFNPELVYWLLLIGLVADVLANFIWMGTTVRFLVYEEEE